LPVRYVKIFAVTVLGLGCLVLVVTAVVDPYGVSPLGINLPRFNANKYKRVDVDRLIKPVEVLQKQPRTIFIGTSRVHESLDPSRFTGSRFAPAYNASIPNITLAETLGYLKEFSALDDKLKYVFIELFFPQFNMYGQTVSGQDKSPMDLASDLTSLFFSIDALVNARLTVKLNIQGKEMGAYVNETGRYQFPPNHGPNPSLNFHGFPLFMLKAHQPLIKSDRNWTLDEPSFSMLDKIVKFGHERNIEVVFLILPNHPIYDHFYLVNGHWGLIDWQEWKRRLAKYPNVIDFSPYNEIGDEKISEHVKYWFDPIHPSVTVGDMVLSALVPGLESAVPQNFRADLNVDTVDARLRETQEKLAAWITANPEYLTAYRDAVVQLAPASAADNYSHE